MTISKSIGKLVLTLAIFIVSLSPLAASQGTIILKNGEQFENVKYDTNNYYKNIRISLEDRIIELGFDHIEKVLDLDNKDITDKVLKKRDVSSGSGEIDDKSEEDIPFFDLTSSNTPVPDSDIPHRYLVSPWKIWNFAIRFSGIHSIPIGDYYEGINSGIGFEGDFRLAVDHHLALRFIVSRSGMSIDDNLQLYSNFPDNEITDHKLKFHGIRYICAVEYYSHTDKNIKDFSMWYLYGGFGAIQHLTSLEVFFENTSTNETWSEKVTDKQSKFLLTGSFGVVKKVSEYLGIEGGVSLDIVSVGYGYNSYGERSHQYSYIFDIKAGICYFFK